LNSPKEKKENPMPSSKLQYPLALRAAALSALVLLSACGGGSLPKSAAGEEALRPAKAGELVAYFKSRLIQRNGGPFANGGGGAVPNLPGETDGTLAGTNLQEAGVDEDDLIKTDGIAVYALHPYGSNAGALPPALEVRTILQDGGLGTTRRAALDPQSAASGMYLVPGAQRVAVLGTRQGNVSLEVFDVPAGAQPARAHQVLIDGTAVSSRRIGNVLYVASTFSPNLNGYWWVPGTPQAQIDAALAGLQVSALLPTIRVNGGSAVPLVAEEDCQLQPANASLGLEVTTITAIDLSTPLLERRSRCFVGSGRTLYMSPAAVYVATSRTYGVASAVGASVMPQETTTDIHKFALQGLQIDYRGSGSVTGHLGWDPEKMPYRMSEYQGDLRIVTYTQPTGWWGVPSIATAATTRQDPPSPAVLTVLREGPAAGRLVQVATLPNRQRPAALGHAGEQVYAVQFAGPLAYVVTFRRTDPLYVLDLSDPTDPKTAGELTVPGYSDYLFPLADGKLLGVGRDASADGLVQGLKIALFDVGDPARPALLASRSLGGRGSSSTLDYSRHGINIFQQGSRARVALPVLALTSGAGQRGLARYVVDTAAGTIQERTMVAPPLAAQSDSDPYSFFRPQLWLDRSIQTADGTYYLSNGQVRYVRESGVAEAPPAYFAAKHSWEASGISNYRFRLEKACFCPSNGPVSVVVRSGQVVSATYTVDGRPVGDEWWGTLPTMTGIYSIADDAYAYGASVRFTVNSARGDLASVFIDYSALVSDDELGYFISDFVVEP
jgi:hypothetical protein